MTGRYVTKTRRVKGSYTDAGRELRAFIIETEGEDAPGCESVTFQQECERFCRRRRAAGDVAESRNRHVECCLKAACKYLGQVPFAEVTPQMLDRMFAAMRAGDTLSGKPSSGTYAKSIGKCVNLVYKQVIKEGRSAPTPARPPPWGFAEARCAASVGRTSTCPACASTCATATAGAGRCAPPRPRRAGAACRSPRSSKTPSKPTKPPRPKGSAMPSGQPTPS